MAEKVGAAGSDGYSLLAAIGRDCIGALQFICDGDDEADDQISGEALDDGAVETLLNGLALAPLGLTRDDAFRISVAGAQEKTALLRYQNRWLKPHGTTPTTHIFKTQIGRLPNGIDLSHSVENEYYCLKLAAAFGLPVNRAEIHTFGTTKALVIERFDRHWTADGRLLRLPQEDCCQALAIPPSRKYQSDGGPGMIDILKLLKGSDDPAKDQTTLLQAQILFWLIGAPDGHAKNFSLFLGPSGGYRLTPLYDVLTAQPSLDPHQIERKQLSLAMSYQPPNELTGCIVPRRAAASAALAARSMLAGYRPTSHFNGWPVSLQWLAGIISAARIRPAPRPAADSRPRAGPGAAARCGRRSVPPATRPRPATTSPRAGG